MSSSRRRSQGGTSNTKIWVGVARSTHFRLDPLLTTVPATAVSRIDNLEFLADVIPKTTTYRQFKEKKAKEASEKAVEAGQTRLGGVKSGKKTMNGSNDNDRMTGVEEGDRVMRVHDLLSPTNGESDGPMPGSSHGGRGHDGDVEMQ